MTRLPGLAVLCHLLQLSLQLFGLPPQHFLLPALAGSIGRIGTFLRQLLLFARQLIECCERVREGTQLLPQLSKDHAARVMALAGEIHEIEGRADETHRRALGSLFDGSSDPLTVMKWREIFDNLELATNHCRDVSRLFEAVVLENA